MSNGRHYQRTLGFPAILILLLGLPTQVQVAWAEASIPQILTTRLSNINRDYPTWVAANAAAQPDGRLDSALFHPVLWDRLQRLLAVPPDPALACIQIGESFQDWVNPPDMTTLEKAFRSSQRVLRGKVTQREFGFDRALPGQLFEVEVLQTFKGQEEFPIYYFFVPVGRFKVGRFELCKTDYRYPNVPEVGDEVVLLVPKVASGDPLLDLPFENGLIVVRGETVLLPGPEKGKVVKERPRAELLADLARLATERRP